MSAPPDGGSIVLERRLREEILRHALEDAPREACGLVLGRDGVAARVVPCRNAHHEPNARYVIHPEDLAAALNDVEDEDRDLVAVYHSHPRSQPVPSPNDREDARRWPRPAYVIATWRTGAPELRAFRLDGDWMREITVATPETV